jgi:predicted RNase H-like HicB family nuclease
MEVRMYRLETEREDDGRWLAEVPELPGVMAYGQTADEAVRKAEALALRVIADRLDHHEIEPSSVHFALGAA